MRESYYSYRGLLVDCVDEYLGIIFVASTHLEYIIHGLND